MSRLQQAQPAKRQGTRARIALAGPTGSGKTWTALTIAQGLSPDGRYLVVDTERASARLYADDFAFTELDWQPPYDPEELATTIREAGDSYDVVIVDSLSHFWKGEGGTLDQVDAAKARKGGQGLGAWQVGDKVQEHMVEALLACKAHVIATMRSKMDYVQEQGSDGKVVITRKGLAPVQRDSIEYEFTLLGDIDMEHRVSITKSRCHPLADKLIPKGKSEGIGSLLRKWLEAADPEPATAAPATDIDTILPADPPRGAGHPWSKMREKLVAMRERQKLELFWEKVGMPGITNEQWIELPTPQQAVMLEWASTILADAA